MQIRIMRLSMFSSDFVRCDYEGLNSYLHTSITLPRRSYSPVVRQLFTDHKHEDKFFLRMFGQPPAGGRWCQT